jgi:hypothetical protein
VHRDEIRIFPGDVESQVRRLERFHQRPTASKLGDDEEDEVSLARVRFLNYSRGRTLTSWQRWLLEGFYSVGIVLLFVLVTSMVAMVGSANAVAAIIACVTTPPAIWLVIIGMRKLRERLAEKPFKSQFMFCC